MHAPDCMEPLQAGCRAALEHFWARGMLVLAPPTWIVSLERKLLVGGMPQALAHALDYLKPFGLDAVLRCSAAFRPFSARGELALSPNALAQLEVLRNHDDGGPRGCARLRHKSLRGYRRKLSIETGVMVNSGQSM